MAFNIGTAKPIGFKIEEAKEVVKQKVRQGVEIPEELPPKGDPWYEDFGEGLAVSGLDLYFGIKDLVGLGSDKDKAILKDWKEDAAESGWGTAGRVTGEIAQIAAPAGLIGKGLKGLSLAKKASLAGRGGRAVMADVLGGAAVGGLRLPEEGETRAGQAALEGGAGLAGGALMAGAKLLPKAVKTLGVGIKQTPEATKLIKEGVPLTPAQSSEGMLSQGVESLLEVTPFFATGIKKIKKEGVEGFSKHALNKALKQVDAAAPAIEDVGSKGYNVLKGKIKRGYAKAWDTSTGFPKETADDMLASIDEIIPTYGIEDAKVLSRLRGNVVKLSKDGSPEQLKALDHTLRKELARLRNNPDLSNEVTSMRNALRNSLPSKGLAQLKKMDKAYPSFLIVEDATAKAASEGGSFNAAQLMQSAKKIGGTGRVASGTSPLLPEAQAGMQTVGRKQFGQPLSFLRRMSGATPSPVGAIRTASEVVSGRTRPQQFIKKGAESILETPEAKALREMWETYGGTLSGARLGAAYRE